jgi:hypothetical protein
MALTLTELMVVPGTGNKRMAIWKVTGDGSSYRITRSDLKIAKVEAAWVENVTNDNPVQIRTETYDYLAGPVDYIDLGDAGGVIDNGGVVLLFVIGY